MNQPMDVDGLLLDWGATLFNQTPIKGKAKKGFAGLVPRAKTPKTGGKIAKGGKVGRDATANTIRGKLTSIAKRSPEVMVKITGAGRGMKQIKAHMDYISRNGKIDLEDQDDRLAAGRVEVEELRDEWAMGANPLPEEGVRREAFNIILSMPDGTNPLLVQRAARDFAAREFDGHQYAMALHTFDTDPDPEPAPNPHVHLVVKATAMDGTRLNPRKADLQRWREGFAQALREHGVEAAATTRAQRLKRNKSQEATRFGTVTAQIAKGGKGRVPKPTRQGPVSAERVARARATAEKIQGLYQKVLEALQSSESAQDRTLAVAVLNRFREDGRVGARQADRGRGNGLER